METRELKEPELHELLTLYQHLHDSDSELPANKNVENTWLEIRNSGNIKYFGVFIGNKLVSSCAITITPNLTRSCRPYALIENVVTEINHRRQGYARIALEKALNFASQLDCYKVILMTGRKDEAIFKFYESIGFNRNDKQAFILKLK